MPVVKPSHSVRPGSLKCTCASMHAGQHEQSGRVESPPVPMPPRSRRRRRSRCQSPGAASHRESSDRIQACQCLALTLAQDRCLCEIDAPSGRGAVPANARAGSMRSSRHGSTPMRCDPPGSEHSQPCATTIAVLACQRLDDIDHHRDRLATSPRFTDSAGLWLTPPRQRTKSIATGQMGQRRGIVAGAARQAGDREALAGDGGRRAGA